MHETGALKPLSSKERGYSDMKKLSGLTFGFSDAENYRRRENKDLFNQIFLRTDALDLLKKENTYFLIGEKGTGKTAYAVYLTNDYDDRLTSSHRFIRETDYQKFITLRAERHLVVSDYVDVWKCILLLLISGAILEKSERMTVRKGTSHVSKLSAVIDEYYHKAFAPEIVYGLQLVENIEVLAKIAAKHGFISSSLEGKASGGQTQDRQSFQTNLAELNRAFQRAINEVQLKTDFALFVDGIDIRPENVAFEDYLACVKGLANAAWALNNDFFAGIKDTSGKARIILLLRPDIFNSLGLQNRNTKLKDNSVVLDWRTNYRKFRESELFHMADKFLSAQQFGNPPSGASWDYYFPFDAKGYKKLDNELTAFILVLRYTYHRPRDILAIFKSLEELYVKTKKRENYFEYNDLINRDFRRSYGEYLLGEIKDALSFYYDETEYNAFLKFFEYLNGKIKFSYDDYLDAFAAFSEFFSDQGKSPPSFMTTPEELLQFLYDQNVICYIEISQGAKVEKFIRWCFQERSPSNISPKVQANRDYEIHYGLSSALNMGKEIKQRRKARGIGKKSDDSEYFVGTLLSYKRDKHFGFIRQNGIPVDIFFHKDSLRGRVTLSVGTKLRYKLGKAKDGRLNAQDVMEVKSD